MKPLTKRVSPQRLDGFCFCDTNNKMPPVSHVFKFRAFLAVPEGAVGDRAQFDVPLDFPGESMQAFDCTGTLA